MPKFITAVLGAIMVMLMLAAAMTAQQVPAEAQPALTQQTPLTASPPPADLSPMGMVQAAHPVVQGVMAMLALATLACWTVLIFKTVEIGVLRRRTRQSCQALYNAADLDSVAITLAQARDPAAMMARASAEEVRRSTAALDAAGPAGAKDRVSSILSRLDLRAAARLRRGIGLLATIGAVAPFVGLFGTVWGIMNAFVSISASGSTNLAVVAPGIAEALLATAVGLVAAIPAVVIYNHFSRVIAGYRLLLGDAAAAIERLVSRDLDFRHRPAVTMADVKRAV